MAETMATKKLRYPRVGMVVDDDALVREIRGRMLEDLCDHVYQASDGLEGLEMLRQHPDISVIVTDIAMPRLDGIAFARAGAAAASRSQGAVRQRPAAAAGQRGVPGEAVSAARALVSAVHHLMEAPSRPRRLPERRGWTAVMTLSIVVQQRRQAERLLDERPRHARHAVHHVGMARHQDDRHARTHRPSAPDADRARRAACSPAASRRSRRPAGIPARRQRSRRSWCRR